MKHHVRTAVGLIIVLSVVGCTPQADPLTMTIEDLESLGVSNGMTVDAASERLPDGVLGVRDVRIEAGVGAQHEDWDELIPADVRDWIIVGQCYFPGMHPPITAAIVPADAAAELAAGARSWNLECTPPPEVAAE